MNELSKFKSTGASGYILLPRALLKQLISESKQPMTEVQAYTTLLTLANYKNTQSKNKLLRRGETHSTKQHLADLFNWSEAKLRRFLKELEKNEIIKINKESNPHTIVLLHYEELCANKKIKTEKKNENENDRRFQLFWQSYHDITQQAPQDIEQARQVWNKLTLNEKETAINNIAEYFMGLPNVKHVRKAVNYLKLKSFIQS